MIIHLSIIAAHKPPDKFFDLLKQNDCQEELNAVGHQTFICRYVVPYAVEKKDIVGLAKLYSWSRHELVKRQALQNLKALLHDQSHIKKKTLWKDLVNIEHSIRPRQDDPKVKDKNIVMLCLEVYRLIISLLYIGIVSGDVVRDDIADILEQRQEANRVLEDLEQELSHLKFDCDQVKSQMYIIGKFLKDKLCTAMAMNKSQVSVMVKQLNHLIEGNLTAADQKSTEEAIQSSMRCLTDKFHQHVIFHYLVILVS